QSPDRSAYAGIDPTAESLHVGNLVTIMTLLHLRRAGHIPYFVIGGSTGLIGDPSGRLKERDPLSINTVTHNVQEIQCQISDLLHNDFNMWSDKDQLLFKQSRNFGDVILNNATWYENFNIVNFLSSVGRHFRMGAMLSRDSVKQRLNSPEGMCLTEFFYQVFQAYDFQRMCAERNCHIQVGGSDQWGNIVAGCEFIHKVDGKRVHGLTVPLLTNASGEKLGKSLGNAIWLSRAKTSLYEFYQYFMRTEDADVEKFLKIFTFIPVNDIRNIVARHLEKPEERYGTKILANEVARLVHGGNKHTILRFFYYYFYLSLYIFIDFLANKLQQILRDVPNIQLKWDKSRNMAELALNCGAVPSFNQGRKLIESGGFYVNDTKITDYKAKVESDIRRLDGRITVVRTGIAYMFDLIYVYELC
ncbi:uncharacterized protein TRIADDRAFT_21492, partial [Trichoplax adhaerens]